MADRYAMPIMMRKSLAIVAFALAAGATSPPAIAEPAGPSARQRSDQDAARRAMLEGEVMPFSVLKRRVEQQMGNDADYIGVGPQRRDGIYRMQYMRSDGVVIWVDVDGKTGDIVRRVP